VPLNTADNCFLIIAKRLKLMTGEETKALLANLFEREKAGNGAAHEIALEMETMTQVNIDRVLRIRERHGRVCRSCKRKTYLLPEQRSKQTPCEFCHSRLIAIKQSGRVERGPLDEAIEGSSIEDVVLSAGLETSNEFSKSDSDMEGDPLFVDGQSGSSRASGGSDGSNPSRGPAGIDDSARASTVGESKMLVKGSIKNVIEELDKTQVAFCERLRPGSDTEQAIKDADSKQLDEDLIGLILDGYKISEKIAAGGMGALYLAKHSILAKQIVIKTLFPRHSNNEIRLQRFIREARAASQLDHPNIVPVINIAQYKPGHFYLSMPYIRGSNLDESVRQSGAFSIEKALTSCIEVASALGMAHKHQILHRDIKPNNLMIDDAGVTKVTDFGLAKMMDSQEKLTKPGMFVGTPLYMAPEIGRVQKLDGRVDIYGLGLTLYYILTAAHAFQRSTVADLMMQRAHKQIPHPKGLRESIPEPMIRCLGKMLAVSLDDRYQSMEEVLVDLKALLAGEDMSAPNSTIWRS
jgi:tRNA A-37 threonylcarbamoyl transferase component Bud32